MFFLINYRAEVNGHGTQVRVFFYDVASTVVNIRAVFLHGKVGRGRM